MHKITRIDREILLWMLAAPALLLFVRFVCWLGVKLLGVMS